MVASAKKCSVKIGQFQKRSTKPTCEKNGKIDCSQCRGANEGTKKRVKVAKQD
jgi:hypothetical protein